MKIDRENLDVKILKYSSIIVAILIVVSLLMSCKKEPLEITDKGYTDTEDYYSVTLGNLSNELIDTVIIDSVAYDNEALLNAIFKKDSAELMLVNFKGCEKVLLQITVEHNDTIGSIEYEVYPCTCLLLNRIWELNNK